MSEPKPLPPELQNAATVKPLDGFTAADKRETAFLEAILLCAKMNAAVLGLKASDVECALFNGWAQLAATASPAIFEKLMQTRLESAPRLVAFHRTTLEMEGYFDDQQGNTRRPPGA